MNVLGIDACRKGWCVVGTIKAQLVWGCFTKIEHVLRAYHDAERILIDIPIGLSSKHFIRTVDAEARTYLKKRKSSIFSPPCRAAVFATNYKDALQLNKELTGKGISIQAYNISPKIREIEEWFNTKPAHVEVYEAHPELCFKSLNAQEDVNFSKHEKQGIEMRKEIVFSLEKALEPIFDDLLQTYKRSEVKPDDILDAMALFLIAKTQGQLLCVQDTHTMDETGKPVRIVYGNSGLH